MKRVATYGFMVLWAVSGCKSASHSTPIDFGNIEDPGQPDQPIGPQPQFDEPSHTSARAPAPLIGGTVLMLNGGTTAAVADPDRDRVNIVDLNQNSVRFVVTLNAGDEPGRAVQDTAGLLHVATRRGGALVSIDPSNGTITARRAVCAAPRGVAFDPASNLLHVACAGGELVSLPAAGGAATRTVQLERDIRDVIVSNSGQLIVSTFRTAQLLLLTADGTVAQRFALPSAIDAFSGQSFASAGAWRMQKLSDGRIIVTHQLGAVGEVQTSQGGYGGSGGCGSIVRTAMAVFDPATQTMSQAIPVPSAVLSADFAVAPIARQLAILSTGNAHTPGLDSAPVFSLDDVIGGPPPSSPDMAGVDGGSDTGGGGGGGDTGGVGTAGGGDSGGGFDGGFGGGCGISSVAFSGLAGEPIALAYDNAERLWVQLRDPAMLVRVDGGGRIPLATDSMADTGWAVFHSNSGAGLACASCHFEGGDDSRIWNFQDVGPRRTQTLRGHVGGTEPFHWSGDLHDFGALLGEVYIKRMSGPTLMGDQSAALFAWINTIPELPQSPPADPAAVARGQTLFTASNGPQCYTCHFGDQMTNNQTLDVGTGGLFQVPRLIGVGWRAPFMHDGCAATLADRFGVCGGGDSHGVTSKLTSGQISDLVAYLQTL